MHNLKQHLSVSLGSFTYVNKLSFFNNCEIAGVKLLPLFSVAEPSSGPPRFTFTSMPQGPEDPNIRSVTLTWEVSFNYVIAGN